MADQQIDRPKIATDEMLVFLDDLRESGRVNMYLAPRELQNEFNLYAHEAKQVFLYWQATVGKDER